MSQQRWAIIVLVVVGVLLGVAIAGVPGRGTNTQPVRTGDTATSVPASVMPTVTPNPDITVFVPFNPTTSTTARRG